MGIFLASNELKFNDQILDYFFIENSIHSFFLLFFFNTVEFIPLNFFESLAYLPIDKDSGNLIPIDICFLDLVSCVDCNIYNFVDFSKFLELEKIVRTQSFLFYKCIFDKSYYSSVLNNSFDLLRNVDNFIDLNFLSIIQNNNSIILVNNYYDNSYSFIYYCFFELYYMFMYYLQYYICYLFLIDYTIHLHVFFFLLFLLIYIIFIIYILYIICKCIIIILFYFKMLKFN
jgi:hypothetical protein